MRIRLEHDWLERSLSALATWDPHCACEPPTPRSHPSPIPRNPGCTRPRPTAMAPPASPPQGTLFLSAPDLSHLLIQAALNTASSSCPLAVFMLRKKGCATSISPSLPSSSQGLRGSLPCLPYSQHLPLLKALGSSGSCFCESF